ncbi:unnamed protein product [Adineta ricciae]|uniref:Uncharacterized protein n=1 Tax=Adineta ricciae TaxID=249248 RepID=A0A814Z3C7_ADIRI|nr:unnamed protein product [Adineta ricciae]
MCQKANESFYHLVDNPNNDPTIQDTNNIFIHLQQQLTIMQQQMAIMQQQMTIIQQQLGNINQHLGIPPPPPPPPPPAPARRQ